MSVRTIGSQAFIVAGALNAIVALAHLACIGFGARGYRLMGAGERVVRAAEAGKLQPTVVTLVIAALLFICTAYAWSAAGLIGHLRGTKVVLVTVCAVYLARAVGFPLLKPAFPGNSTTFWLVSSGICLLLGLVHLVGVVASWRTL